MTRLQTVVILLLCGQLAAEQGAAQDRGTKRPPMNAVYSPAEDEALGIEQESRERISANVSDDEEKAGGFHWPALPKPKLPALPKPSLPKLALPTWSSTQTVEKPRMNDEPSTWQKFNSGTKSMLTKTKHTLMPWTADEEETTMRKKPPATRRTARATTSKNKHEKKSFFSSWLETREEQKPIETVNDYLALPRVPYD